MDVADVTAGEWCIDPSLQPSLPAASTQHPILFQSFPQLPSELQSYILVMGGAPLNTCKASFAILKDPRLTAAYMLATNRLSPAWRAAQLKMWDVCFHLVSNPSYTPSQYSLCTAFAEAAAHAQLELVKYLLNLGMWDLWCSYGDRWKEKLRKRSRCRSFFDLHKMIEDPRALTQQPLEMAAGNGHHEVCRVLLQHQAEFTPDFPLEIIRSALVAAASAGHLQVCEVLLQLAPNLAEPSYTFLNPLSVAAKAGHLHILCYLLQQGADPQNKPGTPLSSTLEIYPCTLASAVEGGSNQALQLLLHSITEWDCPEEWVQALTAAASQGDLPAVRLLLGTAPHNQVTQDVWPISDLADPLCIAVQQGSLELAQLLLEHGIRDRSITSATYLAAREGQVDLLQLLVQHGADVNDDASLNSDSGPLSDAIAFNRAAAVEWLLNQDAIVSCESVVRAVHSGSTDSLKVLLRHGIADNTLRSVLCAARLGRLEHVQLLLEHPGTFKKDFCPRHMSEDQQAAAQRALAHQLALCGAASMGQVHVVEWVLHVLVADSNILAPLQADTPLTAAVSDAGEQEGGGTEASSTAPSTRAPSSLTPVVQEALGAAIAPQGYRQQLKGWCSGDECWFVPAGVDIPRKYTTVVDLLLAHGAGLTVGTTKLLMSAIKYHSREGLGILLETPVVAASITPAVAKDLLVAALFYDNTLAASRLLPLVQQDSFFHRCAQECAAVPNDVLKRTPEEWLLQFRTEEMPVQDRALLLALNRGKAGFAALLVHQGVHVTEQHLQWLWPLAAGPGGQWLLQALEGRGLGPPSQVTGVSIPA